MNVRVILTGMLSLMLCFGARAQLSLSGTSYQQSFDGIGGGLPAGWEVDSAATATSKGFPMSFDTSRVAWSSTAGRTKNYAAKGGFAQQAGVSSATQGAASNRALGIRQVSATDSGIAFTLTLAQTAGLSNLSLSFKLQSLDSGAGRNAAWAVQYAIGATPVIFTTVNTTGSLSTGGNSFASNNITAAFGAALDNITVPVTIRIASLGKTTGSGTRPATAIDSFALAWTGVANPDPRPTISALIPAPGSSGVQPGLPIRVIFNRFISQGTSGSFTIRNVTDGTTTFKAYNSSDISCTGDTATIFNAGLAGGKYYQVTFDSAVFDTAAFASYGLYDTSAWTFSTGGGAVATVTSLNENFSAACAAGNLPPGWIQRNVAGAQQWKCYTTGSGNAKLEIDAGTAGASNEDWLITPRVDVSGYMAPVLRFEMNKRYAGPELEVLVSADYDGGSAPSTATWAPLAIPMQPGDTSVSSYRSYTASLTGYKLAPVFIAFKYSSTATAGYRIRIDTVTVMSAAGVEHLTSSGPALTALGEPTSQRIKVLVVTPVGGSAELILTDLAGRMIHTETLRVNTGENRLVISPSVSLTPGMYVVAFRNLGGTATAKVVVGGD